MGAGQYAVFFLLLCAVRGDDLSRRPAFTTRQHKNPMEAAADTVITPNIDMANICPGVCQCQPRDIVCNGKQLHNIPEGLPNDTESLYINGNLLTYLDSHMFRELPLLWTFSATYNQISVVKNGTFSSLANLIIIDLSKNPLLVSSLENIFCSLQSLPDSEIRLDAVFENDPQVLSKEQFRCLQDNEVYRLSLVHNNFADLPDGLFARLDIGTLVLTNTSSSTRYNTRAFMGVRRITEIDLEVNNMRFFPRFDLAGGTLVPGLTVLSLSHNAFSQLTINDMEGLDDLESLDLSNILSISLAFYVEPGTLSSLPSLGWMKYRGNAFDLGSEQASMFRSTSITYLDVSGLNVNLLDGEVFTFDMFRTMPNLTTLLASRLDFSWFLGADRESFLAFAFQGLSRLVLLDLSKNQLNNLHPDMFNGSSNLKVLKLQDNLLNKLQYGLFSGLVSLRNLDISHNRIKLLQRDFFPENGQYLLQLSSLKVGGNHFSCICALQWFTEFVRRYPKIFADLNDSKCATPTTLEGTLLADFKISANDCALPIPVAFFIAVAASGVCLLILLSGSFLYRFRWHIKFLFFQMKSTYFRNSLNDDRHQYRYDVFVSYHGSSLRWVKSVLLRLLEDKLGLKVCLHDRDWLAGRDIVENIVTSIDESRKVVLVVTNAFARSQWCLLELTMAQHRLLEKDRNNMILIVMEDIHHYNMSPRLALQMKTQTYIEWNQDEKAQELFKRQLTKAVEQPSSGIRLQAV